MVKLFVLYYSISIFFGVLCLVTSKDEKRNRFLKRIKPAANVNQNNSYLILMSFVLHTMVMLMLLLLRMDASRAFIIAVCVSIIPPVLKLAGNRKYRQQLDEEIQPLLINLSNALFADPSLQHALSEARNESAIPMKNELNKVLAAIESGAVQNDALQSFSEKVEDEVIDMAVNGILICSETGGQLASYLCRLAELKRDRKRLAGRIAAMASQQKATAKIVAIIPIVFLGLVWMTNQSFFSYFQSPTGVGIILYSVISITAGFIVMNKMTDLFPDV